MTAPVIRQFVGTIPDKGQAQTAFDTNVDAFLDWQALQFAPDLVAFGTFASDTAAALVAANLPSLTGRALDAVRVNAAADDVEFADVTAAGWALLDDANAAAQRTTLGVAEDSADADLTVTPDGALRRDIGAAAIAAHGVVQRVYAEEKGYSSGATQFLLNDTIPLNTQGFEVLTAAITPKATGNRLRIEARVFHSASSTGRVGLGLFQDSTAGALKFDQDYHPENGVIREFALFHEMAAGTTSETTFKIRVGPFTSTTLYINGNASTRLFGGVMAATLTITEIKA